MAGASALRAPFIRSSISSHGATQRHLRSLSGSRAIPATLRTMCLETRSCSLMINRTQMPCAACEGWWLIYLSASVHNGGHGAACSPAPAAEVRPVEAHFVTRVIGHQMFDCRIGSLQVVYRSLRSAWRRPDSSVELSIGTRRSQKFAGYNTESSRLIVQ